MIVPSEMLKKKIKKYVKGGDKTHYTSVLFLSFSLVDISNVFSIAI